VALVLSVAVVGVDRGTGDVTYSATLVDSVTVADSSGYEREVRLGTVTFRNPSPVPKETGYARYDACLVGVDVPERRGPEIGADVDYYSNDLLPGGATRTANLTAYLPRGVTNTTSTFTVVRTNACPDSSATPTIAVYEREPYR
ncbi:hypothetical protein ACFQE1_19075, partial [Halobium palmae]